MKGPYVRDLVRGEKGGPGEVDERGGAVFKREREMGGRGGGKIDRGHFAV